MGNELGAITYLQIWNVKFDFFPTIGLLQYLLPYDVTPFLSQTFFFHFIFLQVS